MTSVCGKCARCTAYRRGSCKGLPVYNGADCPQRYTKLVPVLYGDVLVRAAPATLEGRRPA